MVLPRTGGLFSPMSSCRLASLWSGAMRILMFRWLQPALSYSLGRWSKATVSLPKFKDSSL